VTLKKERKIRERINDALKERSTKGTVVLGTKTSRYIFKSCHRINIYTFKP